MRKSRCSFLPPLIAAMMLLGAGVQTGWALEVEISGELLVGFGRASLESTTPETDQLDGIGEATLNFSIAEGPVSGQIEITLVETVEELDTAEHEVTWAINETLSLTVSGFSFGIEPADGNISVVMAPGGPAGDEEAFIDFADTGILNVEWTVGRIILGLALLDACIPQCGYALDSTAAEPVIHPEAELMTVVAHLRGKAGPIQYNAYLSSSSGSFVAGTTLVDGNGQSFGFGLCMNLGCWEFGEEDEESGIFGFGLDFSTTTTECAPTAGDTLCRDDNEVTQSGVAVGIAGFASHYYFSKDETGTAKVEITNIDIVYGFEVGPAVIGPEYRLTTTEPTGAKKTTDSIILLGMLLEF